MRARVFISCGQSKHTNEIQIAHQIKDRLERLGFDAWVAVEEQTVRGLTENIFEQLRKSEYYVFVDFKRERLGASRWHRGSLFSHQEFAIAAFLDIGNVVAFQEMGVKTDDGMLRVLQGNAIQFTDRHTLSRVIADTVRQRRWRPNWRNELVLARKPKEATKTPTQFRDGSIKDAWYFHIEVHNHHREKMATNCNVYLEKAIKLPNTIIQLKTVEFKWEGFGFPSVGIAAGKSRAFDAFFIMPSAPTKLCFNVFTDSPAYYPRFPEGPGEYELSYLVTALNFPPARGSFHLSLNSVIGKTRLR
jgi:hypothetical protein